MQCVAIENKFMVRLFFVACCGARALKLLRHLFKLSSFPPHAGSFFSLEADHDDPAWMSYLSGDKTGMWAPLLPGAPSPIPPRP